MFTEENLTSKDNVNVMKSMSVSRGLSKDSSLLNCTVADISCVVVIAVLIQGVMSITLWCMWEQ